MVDGKKENEKELVLDGGTGAKGRKW